jgi:hypothetical protein
MNFLAFSNAFATCRSTRVGHLLFVITLYPVYKFEQWRVFTSTGYITEGKDTESESVYTDWHHAGEAFAGREISVQLKNTSDLTDSISLILSVGIQMGMPITAAVVKPVKFAGSAKIMDIG